jgi:hypothetical protein
LRHAIIWASGHFFSKSNFRGFPRNHFDQLTAAAALRASLDSAFCIASIFRVDGFGAYRGERDHAGNTVDDVNERELWHSRSGDKEFAGDSAEKHWRFGSGAFERGVERHGI